MSSQNSKMTWMGMLFYHQITPYENYWTGAYRSIESACESTVRATRPQR